MQRNGGRGVAQRLAALLGSVRAAARAAGTVGRAGGLRRGAGCCLASRKTLREACCVVSVSPPCGGDAL
eukprot:974713-Pleurochrysis_carterae.AAC.1